MGRVYASKRDIPSLNTAPKEGVSVTDILAYVGSNDAAYATEVLSEALALLHEFLEVQAEPSEDLYAYIPAPGTTTEPVWYSQVPGPIMDRVILEVSSELFARKNAPSGLQQFATADGVPVRLNRDPLTQSYPLLQRYVLGY